MSKYFKISTLGWILGIQLFLLLPLTLVTSQHHKIPRKIASVKNNVLSFRPCCFFPCQNGGVCIDKDNHYICDCTEDFIGQNCGIEKPISVLKKLISYFAEVNFNFLHLICTTIKAETFLYCPYYEWMFKDALNDAGAGTFYSVGGEIYPTLDSAYFSVAVRLTPPVTKDCPTPLGVRGKKTLPAVSEVYEKLLKRTAFIPNKNINVLFAVYGQHLALQFLEEGDITGITCKQIYCEYQRSFVDGKMKMEKYKNEDYPIQRPYLRSWPEYIFWQFKSDKICLKEYITRQSFLTFAITTLWVREHNRVCDILKKEWKNWDDERLFQTARNIITGEMLVITTSEWLPVLIGSKTDLFYEPAYANIGRALIVNRMTIETFLAFHWPHLLPDSIQIKHSTINITLNMIQCIDEQWVKEHGTYDFLRSLALTYSGEGTLSNSAESLSRITALLIEEGRRLRFPSLNKIRTAMTMKAYTNFINFDKSEKKIHNLKKLYGDIEGLEFVTGMLIEPSEGLALGETATTLIKHWLFRALLTHPVGSKSFWRPGTFGGNVGWDIVKNARFMSLACTNVNATNLCEHEGLMTFRPTSQTVRVLRKRELKKKKIRAPKPQLKTINILEKCICHNITK